MALKITIKVEDENLTIYFNGLMHINIKTDELIGIQSWVDGDKGKGYFIEYLYRSGASFYSRYPQITKWERILKLLDKNVVWNIQNK